MVKSINDGSEYYQPRLWRLVDGAIVEESDVVVHTFSIGDAEDPDLLAGLHIVEWQESEMGHWVMDNCIGKPYWTRMIDPTYYGYCYRIVARLTTQNETFFELKFR